MRRRLIKWNMIYKWNIQFNYEVKETRNCLINMKPDIINIMYFMETCFTDLTWKHLFVSFIKKSEWASSGIVWQFSDIWSLKHPGLPFLCVWTFIFVESVFKLSLQILHLLFKQEDMWGVKELMANVPFHLREELSGKKFHQHADFLISWWALRHIVSPNCMKIWEGYCLHFHLVKEGNRERKCLVSELKVHTTYHH